MSDGLLTHVGVPDRPANVRCKGCRKTLQVDTGLTVEGIAGSWAHCWSCGTTTCGMGRHRIAKPAAMQWEDGLTSGDGYRVPCCTEGGCEVLYVMQEQAIAAFRYPEGQAAQLVLVDMRERAKGSERSWIGIVARVMLSAFDYFSVVKRELDRQRNAEMLHRPLPRPKSFEEWSAAQEAKQVEAARRVRDAAKAFEDILGYDPLLPVGADLDLMQRFTADMEARS